jgi:hypothetical protein
VARVFQQFAGFRQVVAEVDVHQNIPHAMSEKTNTKPMAPMTESIVIHPA